MKSKLFGKHSVLSKEFGEDISLVASLSIPGDILDILPEALYKYLVAQSPKDEAEALDSIREKWPIKFEEFNSVRRFGVFLLQALDIEDTVEDIMSDLKTLESIEESQVIRLRTFIKAFVNEFERFELDRLTIATQKTGIKRLSAVSHTIDFRAVVSNSREVHEDVDEYQPNIASLVPVTILYIRLTDNKDFLFQMDKYALALLKNELLDSEKEMNNAILFVGKEKTRMPGG